MAQQASTTMPSPSLTSRNNNLSSASASWMSMHDHSSSSIRSNAVRSSPIAIVQNDGNNQQRGKENDDSSDSSASQASSTFDVFEDKEDEQRLMVGPLPSRSPSLNPWTRRSSRSRHGNKHGSLLARSLPAAPVLRARGGPNWNMEELDIPPISLVEAADPEQFDTTPQKYGSLRDSHLEGRFLDGPSSYREKGSGMIRSYVRSRHVRFDDSSTSYQNPMSFPTAMMMSDKKNVMSSSKDSPSMGSWSRQTPGERMQEALKLRQEEKSDEATTSQLRSSLSSLMLSAEAGDSSTTTSPSPAPQQQQYEDPYTHRHHNNFDDHRGEEEEMKLCTSLTGFEILQRTQQHSLRMTSTYAEGGAAVQEVASDATIQLSMHSHELMDGGDLPSTEYSQIQDHPDTIECFDLDME